MKGVSALARAAEMEVQHHRKIEKPRVAALYAHPRTDPMARWIATDTLAE